MKPPLLLLRFLDRRGKVIRTSRTTEMTMARPTCPPFKGWPANAVYLCIDPVAAVCPLPGPRQLDRLRK